MRTLWEWIEAIEAGKALGYLVYKLVALVWV